MGGVGGVGGVGGDGGGVGGGMEIVLRTMPYSEISKKIRMC